MTRRRNRERTGIEANLTSLIDVTFLLIVFFVLVSRLNEIESIELNLPTPQNPISEVLEGERQVIINVVPGEGGAVNGYRVGVTDFPPGAAGLSAMTLRLTELYQANPSLNVNVRADRATHYEHVEPVMQAVSTAAKSVAGALGPKGVARVNLAVMRGTGQ